MLIVFAKAGEGAVLTLVRLSACLFISKVLCGFSLTLSIWVRKVLIKFGK